MTIEAILWDFGGVLTTSPFEAFNRYEAERGIPRDFIRTVNATNPETNAWAQFESSSVDIDTFDRLFEVESTALGHRIPGREVIALLSGDVRPRMVEMLRRCKARFRVGCITNNVRSGHGPGMASSRDRATRVADVMALFDLVVESSVEGIRKPNPRIYELACERLGVHPERAVFLDDLGINLKPARALGMRTIKVEAEEQALRDLAALTGIVAP
ncbi:MAG: HAD-IA family hydrolase [Gammaproteobacteria bacterium]